MNERLAQEITPLDEAQTPRTKEGIWAKPTDRLQSNDVNADMNINVDGKRLAGPLRGFGQMWQKTYSVRLEGVEITPQQVIKVWKENFGDFWPKGNRFYGSTTGIAAGDVAVLNLAGPGGITAPGGKGLISTGVLVIYSDEESFTFMTPEGHMFGGLITFTVFQEEFTIAQIQALIRANDPIYEMGALLGIIHKSEDQFWHKTLENLARHFGSIKIAVQQKNDLVDPRVQWSQAGNVWQNAAIRTGIYLALTPFRWIAGLFRPKKKTV